MVVADPHCYHRDAIWLDLRFGFCGVGDSGQWFRVVPDKR